VYLAIGYFLKKLNIASPTRSSLLNFIVINFCLPALALVRVPEMQFTTELLMPISVAWIVFTLAIIFFTLLKKRLLFSNNTLGSLILCCGLFNSAFIGFPVVNALYGKEGLSIAIMTDQPGSFLVLSTLGIFSAAYFSSGKTSWLLVLKKVFSFPPFWAFIAALILLILKIKLPAVIVSPLSLVATLLTPLALISVGLQLNFSFDKAQKYELIAGLTFKLVIAPAFILALFYLLKNELSLVIKVSVLQAAMAPMISGSILAINHQLNPKLANALVGIGIPLSFLTLSIWYILLSFVL
jgi:predicted permease